MRWATKLLGLCAALGLSALAAREITLTPNDALQDALDRASPGDVVTLKGGKYQGPLVVRVARIVVQSAVGETAQLSSPVDGKAHACVSITAGGSGAVLRGLDVSGGAMHAVDVQASGCVLENCRFHDSGADCVKCSPGADKLAVRACEIYNSGRDAGWNGNAEGIDNVRGDNMHVADCYIHDIATNGLYVKGGARGLLVERCLFQRIGLNKDVMGCGVIAGEHAGGTKEYECYDSVVRNCIFLDVRGAAMSAWCAKNAKFYNNTCVNVATHDRAGFIILENHGLPSKDVVFVNNIVVVGSKRKLVWIYPKGADGLVLDHNLYFGGDGQFEDMRANWRGNLEQWREKLKGDAHSACADPKLDAGAHLTDGSPAVDQGQAVEGLADDYDGGKREGPVDIGADEFKSGEALKVPPAEGTTGAGRKATAPSAP